MKAPSYIFDWVLSTPLTINSNSFSPNVSFQVFWRFQGYGNRTLGTNGLNTLNVFDFHNHCIRQDRVWISRTLLWFNFRASISQNGQTHSNNFLSVFDHFVTLALKVLTLERVLTEIAMIKKNISCVIFFPNQRRHLDFWKFQHYC